MPLDITSFFESKIQEKYVQMNRRFYIGTSDYSEFVVKWPKISRKWNDIRPKTVTINLANEDKDFNAFITNPLLLMENGSFEFGIKKGLSWETIELFVGQIKKVKYVGGTASITIEDKFKQFGERTIGTRENAVDFTTSDYYPSDIAWILITCYGGLSSIASDSNPDIDYDSYVTWQDVFSFDNVRSQAYFTGEKILDALRVIGRNTASSIYEEAGKITFGRFTSSSEAPFTLPTTNKVTLLIDDSKVINRQYVNAAYDVTSREFGITVFDENGTSVNSYGAREQTEDSTKFWYVDSVSALNLSQRMTSLYSEPYNDYSIETPLFPLGRTIGDTVTFSHSILDESGNTYRVMSYDVDMDKCTMNLGLDATQLSTPFVLDDSIDGLLDQAYNPLG